MQDLLPWSATIIVGVITFFLGKKYERINNRKRKDDETLTRLTELLLKESMNWIGKYDFGGRFEIEELHFVKTFLHEC